MNNHRGFKGIITRVECLRKDDIRYYYKLHKTSVKTRREERKKIKNIIMKIEKLTPDIVYNLVLQSIVQERQRCADVANSYVRYAGFSPHDIAESIGRCGDYD